LIGPSLSLLADGVEQAKPFFEQPELSAEALSQLQTPGAIPALNALLDLIPDQILDHNNAQQLIGQACEIAGVKKGVLMKSMRAALLGRLQGPDLIETWLLLNSSGDDRIRLHQTQLSS
jgi:glutamyl-tRNA synthetase